MAFDKNSRGTARMYSSVSDRISDYRSGKQDAVAFEDADRDAQETEKKKRGKKKK
jgi:hypothetical protein